MQIKRKLVREQRSLSIGSPFIYLRYSTSFETEDMGLANLRLLKFLGTGPSNGLYGSHQVVARRTYPRIVRTDNDDIKLFRHFNGTIAATASGSQQGRFPLPPSLDVRFVPPCPWLRADPLLMLILIVSHSVHLHFTIDKVVDHIRCLSKLAGRMSVVCW